MGVLHAESSNDLFYPMSPMTRQDAAVILVSAFKMDNLENDYLAHFSDKDQISEECYQALNTLVGRNFMRVVQTPLLILLMELLIPRLALLLNQLINE